MSAPDSGGLASEALAAAVRGDHRQARRKLSRAARTGDADLLFHIGQVYRLGLHDVPAAMGSYQRAADLGSTAAMAQLGALYADQRDWAQAEHWLRRALTEGDSLEFVVAYARVLGELGRRAEARQWCQRAADAGDGLAAAMLRLYDDQPAPAPEPAEPRGYRMRVAELPILGVLSVLFDQYRSNRYTVSLEVALAKGREYLDGLDRSEVPSMDFCVLWRRLLRAQYAESGSDELSSELVEADRMRVAAAVPEDPDYPVYLVDLAGTLLAAMDDRPDPGTLDEATDLLHRGLARLSPDHPEHGPAQALLLGTVTPTAILARAAAAGSQGRLAEARAALVELTETIDHALRTLPGDDPDLTAALTAQQHAGQAAARMIHSAQIRGDGAAATGESELDDSGRRTGAAVWHLSVGEPDQAVAAIEPVTASIGADPGGTTRDGPAAHAHWVHAMASMATGDAAGTAHHTRAALRYARGVLGGAGKPAEPAAVAAAWVVADLAVLAPAGLGLGERISLLDGAADACGAYAGTPARLARLALVQQRAALLVDALGQAPDPTVHPEYGDVRALIAEVLAARQELHDDADPDRRAELATAQLLAARVAILEPGGPERAVALVGQAWQAIDSLGWQREALRQHVLAVAAAVAPVAGDAVRQARAAGRWPDA